MFDCFGSLRKHSVHVGNAGWCIVRPNGVGFGLLFTATHLLLFLFGFHQSLPRDVGTITNTSNNKFSEIMSYIIACVNHMIVV